MDKLLMTDVIRTLLRFPTVQTDHGVFRLHYKLTATVLLVCSILVSATQFFGEPIHCLNYELSHKSEIMNNYCWVEGTITLPRSLNGTWVWINLEPNQSNMKSLLCATLAVLLVAAVTAQSSQQPDDASAIQGLIEKIHTVVGSLGGFEGTINKLEYITKLVEKAYNDDGIGGWMARNLIKLELSQLKEKALNTEKDMINNLLDQLESKAGMKTYSSDLAENYLLSESVKKAIALIRESIQQILSEISKAQKEHDQAAGKIGQDAMNKINEHLRAAKEKLKGLTKKLLDKLTGRDKTAEVYGADGGIRYQAPSESYILSEMIKIAAQQLRERIFKYIELIGEAKRAAQKEFGKNKELALEHLRKLNERLRQAMADLRDTLLGKKTTEELEEEIKEGEDVNEAVQFLSLQTYGANDAKTREELIKELQEKILENIKQLENAKRVAEEKLTKGYAVQSSENYILDGAVKELVGKLRVKIMEVIEELGKAKREAAKAVGEARQTAREHLRKLRQQLRKLTKDLRDAIVGRKNKDELEKDLELTTEATF